LLDYEDIKQMDRDVLVAKALRNHQSTIYRLQLINDIMIGGLDPVKALFIWAEYLPPLDPGHPRDFDISPDITSRGEMEATLETPAGYQYDLLDFLTGEYCYWYDLTGLSKREDLIPLARKRLIEGTEGYKPWLSEEERVAQTVINIIRCDTFTGFRSTI